MKIAGGEPLRRTRWWYHNLSIGITTSALAVNGSRACQHDPANRSIELAHTLQQMRGSSDIDVAITCDLVIGLISTGLGCEVVHERGTMRGECGSQRRCVPDIPPDKDDIVGEVRRNCDRAVHLRMQVVEDDNHMPHATQLADQTGSDKSCPPCDENPAGLHSS